MDSENGSQAVTENSRANNGLPQCQDEYDLEQLAAFLEEPDSDDDNPGMTAGTDPIDDPAETMEQVDGGKDFQNSTDKRLTSFLEQLDSDDEGAGNTEVEQAAVDPGFPADSDKQLAAFLEERDSDEDGETGSGHDKLDVAQATEQGGAADDFQDEFDDEDAFGELACLIEAQSTDDQSTAGTGSQSHVKSAGSSFVENGSNECENEDISMETKSVSMAPSNAECEDNSVVGIATGEVNSASDSSEDNDDDDDVDKQQIRAAMLAMEKQMKQLQAMLKKTPGKNKKKSPKPNSPATKNPEHTLQKLPSASLTEKGHDAKVDDKPKHDRQGKNDSCKSKPSGKVDSTNNYNPGVSHNTGNKIKDSVVLKNKTSRSNVSTKDLITTGSSILKEKANTNSNPPVTKKQKITGSDDSNLFFDGTNSDPDTKIDEKDKQAVDPKSLFGDSDDSDWEGMDEEDKRELTDQGKEIKKLMTGPRQRTAHTPTYDSDLVKKPNAWIAANQRSVMNTDPVHKPKLLPPSAPKPQINPDTGTVSGKYMLRDEYKPKSMTAAARNDVEEREIATDPFCGIRIVNPRISMAEFKVKMAGRAMIKIPRLLSRYGKQDLQKDNWVTMGVVVHRTEPRQSAAGKPFCIWRLSDLLDCDKTVTFFLFGNVYKEHWKNELGVVVGLLNPSPMDKAEKAQADVAFTISHPQQMLVIGVAKDLGRCHGTTKSGQPCSSFINKSQGEFCTYHVQAAYKKSSSRRSELQASTGNIPKAFQKKTAQRKANNDLFFYGGQSFSVRPDAKPAKDNVTLKKLQHLEAGKSRGKVTTMSLHELEPQDSKRLLSLREKDKALLEMLAVPSSGSMNFVKHLVQKDTKKPVPDAAESEQAVVQSTSATDLLRDHKHKLVIEKKGKQLLTSLPTLGKGFGQRKEISLDAPVKKTNLAAELAKQLAIAKVKSKGGIAKDDPNAVRNKLVSPEAKEKIKKRVREDHDVETSPSDKAPPKKRSKLLGNVDLNSPEVQKLLKSKSKHVGALAEAEAEHEDRYFSQLEKKEKMEDKMATIMEQATMLFYCKQCDYKHFSLHDRCKKENHPVTKVKGVKRFFKCKHCKRRSVSIEKFPTTACSNCGESKFERVSMLNERSGPKLDSEQLSLRGNEQKYLGSLQQKSFLNIT